MATARPLVLPSPSVERTAGVPDRVLLGLIGSGGSPIGRVELPERVQLLVRGGLSSNQPVVRALGRARTSSSSLRWVASCWRLCVCWMANTITRVTDELVTYITVSHHSGNPTSTPTNNHPSTATIAATPAAAWAATCLRVGATPDLQKDDDAVAGRRCAHDASPIATPVEAHLRRIGAGRGHRRPPPDCCTPPPIRTRFPSVPPPRRSRVECLQFRPRAAAPTPPALAVAELAQPGLMLQATNRK